MIAVWCYCNSDKHDNNNKPVALYISQIEQEAEKVLLTMWGYQILGSWFHKNIRCNDNDESSEEEVMKMSLREESSGHRYFEISQYYSINSGGCKSRGHRSEETSHSTSFN